MWGDEGVRVMWSALRAGPHPRSLRPSGPPLPGNRIHSLLIGMTSAERPAPLTECRHSLRSKSTEQHYKSSGQTSICTCSRPTRAIKPSGRVASVPPACKASLSRLAEMPTDRKKGAEALDRDRTGARGHAGEPVCLNL